MVRSPPWSRAPAPCAPQDTLAPHRRARSRPVTDLRMPPERGLQGSRRLSPFAPAMSLTGPSAPERGRSGQPEGEGALRHTYGRSPRQQPEASRFAVPATVSFVARKVVGIRPDDQRQLLPLSVKCAPSRLSIDPMKTYPAGSTDCWVYFPRRSESVYLLRCNNMIIGRNLIHKY